ncbi:hypothetical protein BKA62DRAFT_50642 [Auriculariales sp. MPI-PUGE-AT-0066]|nr:hypothetical protein BKA62DRAFT_50642 [Auriculariales sp. MPI-PUGE-AT-0066]
MFRMHDIPADIWQHIASYMPDREVERLMLLNRTFADLAALQERRTTLVLNTNTPYPYSDVWVVAADFVATANEIAKRLEERIHSRGAAHLRQLVFDYRMHPTYDTVPPRDTVEQWFTDLIAITHPTPAMLYRSAVGWSSGVPISELAPRNTASKAVCARFTRSSAAP